MSSMLYFLKTVPTHLMLFSGHVVSCSLCISMQVAAYGFRERTKGLQWSLGTLPEQSLC